MEYGGCQSSGSVTICRARGFAYRVILPCKFCGERRRHLIEDEVWYGTTRTCLACGSTWDSDMGQQRLTQKRRHENRERARALWPTASTRAEHRTWWRAELDYMREVAS